MPSASDRVRASGFSTSTVLPSSSACMTGLTCSPSLVATITAFTSGREMAARLSPELNCAPILCARSRARAGSASEIAMKLTPGCPAASPARRLPMRPAPTTAIPSCLRSIISLLGSDAGVAREAALLLELRSDVIAEVFRRAARLQLDAALDEALGQLRVAHGFRNCPLQAHENVARRSRRGDEAVEGDVLVARHARLVHGRDLGKERRARGAPECDLASATSSLTDCAGRPGLTTSTWGTRQVSVMPVKSFSGS